MKSYVILLTSAIHTNYGIYSTTDRVIQTIRSVLSIRKFIKNSTIILIDNSKIDIHNDSSILLQTLLGYVDFYIDNSKDPNIEYFHKNISNYDIGKNMMEALGTLNALHTIVNNSDLFNVVSSSSRVFKLSGRYEITNNFNINNFDNEGTKEKYIFKKKDPSWIPSNITGVTTQLQTRLWCFDPILLKDTLELYKNIVENMARIINLGGYIDNEHSMSKFISEDKLIELSHIGVVGNIAPNGAKIIE
jgi:hypothetical protein